MGFSFVLINFNVRSMRSNEIRVCFSYIHQIKGLIENGAPINGIGVQGHLGPSSIDLQKVEHSLNKLWNEFGIPIWITEFDWANQNSDSDNHEQHAIELENFYRLMLR